MPELKAETQPTEDLDQRVETLLRQMETAAEAAAGLAAEAEASDLADAATDADDLSSEVDRLLSESPEGESAAEPATIGSLDDELARLASELIEGEYLDDSPPPPILSAPRPAAEPPSEARTAAAASVGDAPIVRHEPAAAPEVVAPPPPARAAIWKHWLGGIVRASIGVTVRATIAVARAIRRHAPTILAFVEPIAYRVAAMISAPLQSRPPIVRHAVGWIALGTTFWASCLLGYFLFLHEPHPPAPSAAAVGLRESADGHGPAEGGHSAEAPAKPASGHESAKPADKAAEAGHGGAATPAPVRPSPLKRPTKSPLGTPLKKPETKAASGGH